MVFDLVEHPLGVVHRTQSFGDPHWLIISARATDEISDTNQYKSKLLSVSENEGGILCLELPYTFSWKMFVVLTIYVNILVTFLLNTRMVDMFVVVIVQYSISVVFLIDFVVAVMHRLVDLPVKLLKITRSTTLLIIEGISLLPLSVIYMIIVDHTNKQVVFALSCIIFLRFYRIPKLFFEQSYTAGVTHTRYTILKMTLYLFLSMYVFSVLWMKQLHDNVMNDHEEFFNSVEEEEQHLFITAMYNSYMIFTNTGFGDVQARTLLYQISCIAAIITGFTLITGVLVGSLTKDHLQREKPRELYRREYHSSIRYLRGIGIGHNTMKKIMEEIIILWNHKKGLPDYKTQNSLPVPLRKEISFDIVYGFLYRSILFANQDRTFLRSVSLIMRNKTYLPGDEIIRPTGISHKMICVTSGVVEIVSVENDSSPIISFTAGTVLGEISLFLAIPIKTIIRASTIVELQVLDAMDFCRLATKYTSNYNSMRADIMNRCNESRSIVLNDAPKTFDPEEPANLRLKTLKDLIHNLKDPKNLQGEEEIPYYDAFKANIRNLYVITENLPKVKVLPMSLLRNKPWILRPNTPYTNSWEMFMFCVVTFVLFFYPYVAAFHRRLDTFVYTVLFGVELFYVLDIVKQCITAVPRDDLYSFKTEVKEIVLTRLRSYGFYLDVLSTYELSVFTPLFTFGTKDHVLIILSLNKMLRIWIIPEFFWKMENEFTINILFIRILKYIYYILCAVNIGAAFLYLEACPDTCHADRWYAHFQSRDKSVADPNMFHPYVISLYLSVMLTSTTGYGSIIPAGAVDKATMMFLMSMGLATFGFVISQLSGTLKHIQGKRTDYQEEIYAIHRFLVEHNLPKKLRERMRRYFRVQWSYDGGTSFQKTSQVDQLPKKLRTIMLNEKLTTLQSIPIFQNAHPGFMLELAKGCEVRVLPDNEMVVYAGSLDREMYILQSGYCTICSKNNPDQLSVIGAYTSFGDLEMLQGVPIVVDVKTLTHVRIICIEYSTYMRAVTKYPDVREHIELLMESSKVTNAVQIPLIVENLFQRHVIMEKNVLKRLWKGITNSLINVYKYDKRHNRNYWEPFSTWNKLRFLQYLFIPIVIKPDSSLSHAWMLIRVATALILGFLAPIYFSLPAVLWRISGLMLSIQIIIWIDIYVTFHFAYYDQKGVLIFHPAKTVVNYMKRSFFLDLIIAFPYFVVIDNFIEFDRPSLVYNGCGLIKVLQYYKFLQACNVYERDIFRRSSSFRLLKHLPTILIVTNLLTALLILIECEATSENEQISKGDSTHARYRVALRQHCLHPISAEDKEHLEMFLIAYYYITASMTTCGFGDVIPTNNTNTIACVLTVMFGVFVYGAMFASVASGKIFAYYNVSMYRTQMTEMMTFLGKENVNEILKTRIFLHYLHNWGRTYGYTPQKTLSNVHTVLKQDIVDWMYESTLRKVAVFNYVDKYFIRCVGKYIDEIYFLEGEEICKHNHIQDEIYIIYRGKIDILDADGNFVTSMGGGGLFGNMTDKSAALSGITAVAATNVDLIRMKADDFHKTLANYPDIKKEIMRLTSLSPDYISPSADTAGPHTNEDTNEDIPSFPAVHRHPGSDFSDAELIQGTLYWRKALFNPRGTSKINLFIVSGSWLHSMLGMATLMFSYISCMTVTYVFAFQDYGLVLIPYIASDIYFLLKFFMEFSTTYIDSRNDHVWSRKLIARKYVKSLRFYFDTCSSFPLEIFALASPSFLIAMSFLRLNRVLRLYYFVDYYKSQLRKLMVNIYVLEIGTLVAWTSILIHCLACVWYLCACPVFFCFEESWLTTTHSKVDEKHEKYLTSLYYIVTIITTTGYGDIKSVTNIELMITTLIMILSHFGLVMGAVTFLAMINVTSLTFVRYEESISQYKKDLVRQKVSQYQLGKLWKYVQFLWWREMGKQIPLFVYSAPYLLRCDMYMAMYGDHLERSYVFSGLDKTFLRQLTVSMKRYVFCPGNYIVQQGDNDGTMYFIHKGEVSVMTIHTDLMETIHYHLKMNDQFGIAQGLIFGEPHVFSYRADTEVEMISLQLSHWQHLLRFFPKIKPIIYARLHKLQNVGSVST